MIKIPNKSHFKSNEVCTLTGVKPYVLRFWESEFHEINPMLSSSGQKLFEHKDIEAVVLVKKLLFVDKLTIEKAKFEIQRIKEAELLNPITDEEQLGLNSGPNEVPEVALSSSSLTMRSLEDNDIEKLILAKSKLSNMLNITQGLQERFNWS